MVTAIPLLTTHTTTNPDLMWADRAFGGLQAERYQTYHAYINGNQPLALASQKFAAAFGALFRAFAYNRSGSVVDAHADSMKITGFHAEEQNELVQAGADIWEANQMDVRAGQVHAELFGMGDSYLLVDQHPVTGAIQYWPQRLGAVGKRVVRHIGGSPIAVARRAGRR